LRLLTELRGEITHADSKASVLLGAMSMSTGLLGALVASHGWTPGQLSDGGRVFWWSGLTSLAGSLFALLMAILPRYGSRVWAPGQPLTYFADIREAARAECLPQALADTERQAEAGLVEALTATSGIVGSKHAWIRAALLAYGVAMLFLPIALLAG
jgi:hypothetical protein